MKELNDKRDKQKERIEIETGLNKHKAAHLILIRKDLYHLNGYLIPDLRLITKSTSPKTP